MEMLPFYISLVVSGVIIIEPLIVLLCTSNIYTASQPTRIAGVKSVPFDQESLSCTEEYSNSALRKKKGAGNPNDFE